MAIIKSRKHAQSRFQQVGLSALASVLLPLAAQSVHAAEPKQPQTLDAVKVTGSQENEFKAEKAASPKYTETLNNTAQTITVIKRELIEQQGAVTLTEALRNTPGIGTFFLGENGNTTTGDSIYMRGFDSSGSIFVDGVRDVGSITRDVFNIEQIDVLKGPAGTDNGRGSPTGSVNLVSKQPGMDALTAANAIVGSGSQKRVSADINRVINADSGSAFRLNLLTQDSGNPARNEVQNKRWAIAPSVAFGLNGPTKVFLNFLHVDQDNRPDGGVPTIGLPGYTTPDTTRPFITAAPRVNPKNFYGALTDFDKVKADMATVRIEHALTPATKLQNTARYGKTSQNYLLTAFMGNTANLLTPKPQDVNTWTLARSTRTIKDQSNEIFANQTTLTSDFTTGSVKHTLVGGLEFTQEKQLTYGYTGTGTLPAANLYNPNPNVSLTGYKLTKNGAFGDTTVSTQSAYVFDTLKLGEQWIFNGGVRFDHYRTRYSGASLSTATSNPTLPVGTILATNLEQSDTLINGKLSALYKPTKDSSVYALYATSKLPPGGAALVLSSAQNSAANPKYDPQNTNTVEIGTKWDFLKQKLSFTAALYRTVVKNELEQDPVDLLYYQSGKKSVKGVEIGLTGELARGWLVSMGYTHMDTKVEAGKLVTAAGVNHLSYTPKNAFTAWTSYNLTPAIKLGGGARYVGEMLRGTDGAIGTPKSIDAYWVFDAMASYQISKNVDLRLNLYNLTDKAYVAAINKSGYRYTPGAPRSASLSLSLLY